jgi:1,4-dihydroxy-2-naphthoyl-CoA hydrolase
MANWRFPANPALSDPEAVARLQQGTLAERIGMRITEIGEDYVRGTLPVDERTRQPWGRLHGGASVALAEELGSFAANLCLDPAREAAFGLEINANHVRAATAGTVTGTARPLHIGRSTHVWEIRIEDEQQRLVCVSRLTMAVVQRQTGAAR